ncbi:hypothetical protein E1B28_012311 [Marasmius oreades]|uniref:Uncharacterized protein n=1 Tax=Marasmius oreades TaxID=181124 RepID=A0A9P7RR77_9AGAR|nr:uncharacterized protein E1B28_012311 [Marasmius oreades]KAG7088301.1 hypothetical protein E1B28_012311 [Marasmius oreades]
MFRRNLGRLLSRQSLSHAPKQNRNFSATVSQLNTNRVDRDDPETKDFRPSWVYQTSRLVSYLLIPGTALYFILIYDHGDHEHVFQPIRRWVARQKASFFTLSPEEEKLMKSPQSASKSSS